ncbi:MAG TPA: acyl-CoA dehydrogenase family protein, partial [Geobacteraceae bacterium]
MERDLTAAQRSLRESVRQFAATELKPGAAQRDRSGEFPWPEVRKLQQFGLFGLALPAAYGGGGRDVLSYTLAVEELARVDASLTL